MGFFQDLKEDLSMAADELVTDMGDQENPGKDGTVEVNEDLFRAAVERLDENAGLLQEEVVKEPAAAEPMVEAGSSEPIPQPAMTEPVIEEPVPVQESVSAQDALVKEVVQEVEQTAEQTAVITELEKEVSKAMAQEMDMELTGEALDETAVITQGMSIKGDIISRGSLEVLGAIKGNVEVLGKLTITGALEGNSSAAEIYADSAHITGDMHASGTAKVGQSSVIIGNLYATSAVVAGAIKGDIDVQGPVVLDTSAIVMGNIKSKSVQINNGAVIEGMCSQCYAEVNPSSFFQDISK